MEKSKTNRPAILYEHTFTDHVAYTLRVQSHLEPRRITYKLILANVTPQLLLYNNWQTPEILPSQAPVFQ